MIDPSRADIEAALAREPDNIAIVARLALVCLRGGDAAAAAPLFERIIAERANDVGARINYAGCMMRLGRATEALPHIAHAASLACTTNRAIFRASAREPHVTSTTIFPVFFSTAPPFTLPMSCTLA